MSEKERRQSPERRLIDLGPPAGMSDRRKAPDRRLGPPAQGEPSESSGQVLRRQRDNGDGEALAHSLSPTSNTVSPANVTD